MEALFQDAWGVIVVLVAVAGGFVYLRSTLAKQSHEELSDLAETRGNTISDLRDELHKLQRKVEYLEGQMTAIQAIKAQEIAAEVARLTPKADDIAAAVARLIHPDVTGTEF